MAQTWCQESSFHSSKIRWLGQGPTCREFAALVRVVVFSQPQFFIRTTSVHNRYGANHQIFQKRLLLAVTAEQEVSLLKTWQAKKVLISDICG